MAADLDGLESCARILEYDQCHGSAKIVRDAIAELAELRRPHPDTVLLNWIIGLGRLSWLQKVRGDCWMVGEAGWIRRTPREAIEVWLREESWEPGDLDPWRWHAPEFEVAMKEFMGSLTKGSTDGD